MTEEERVIRAKKQLILVGAACVALLIFVLWVTRLKTTLAYLNQRASPIPLQSFKETDNQLGPRWTEFKKQLLDLKK
ncbi:hypothetical protein HYW17_00355 [Candidatus Uhrbacteria bacterium]|nr:hypothetical protein [Candidatus Uhrbacteria bacterium]